MAETIVRHTNLYLRFPHMIGVGFVAYYLIGPLYYFYFKTTLQAPKWSNLLSLAPVILPIWRRGSFYFSSGSDKISSYEVAFIKGKFGITLAPEFFNVSVNIFFIILAIRLIKKFEQQNTSQYNWKWAKILSYSFIVFWLLYLQAIVILSFGDIYSITVGYARNLGLAVIIIIISYHLIYTSEAFKFLDLGSLKKYKKSKMRQEELDSYAIKINSLLADQKPYLDNEFNQARLAESLGITSNKVSQILTEQMQTNFYDLINKLRTEEMQSMLLNPEYKNLTIMGIGFSAGFNSKTSMTRNFKKITGQTPSEFLKGHS
ncbi:MAG: helix-turn-helix domain-containing protein [Cyclobacteriaceae bacterium]